MMILILRLCKMYTKRGVLHGRLFSFKGGVAGQSHRLCLPETVILPRRYFAPQKSHTERLRQGFLAKKRRKERGASNVRCLPALYAQRSHTEKRRLDGWRTERLWQGFLAQRRRKERGASNVRCLSAFRAQKVSINVRAMHERHLHKTALPAGAG